MQCRQVLRHSSVTILSDGITSAFRLRLCSDEDWDVSVGVFPEGEEILICGSSFGDVALHGVGAEGSPRCASAPMGPFTTIPRSCLYR
jgi:hypothetical protein